MMTSISSSSDCFNSYSMFTSHFPAFSDGQQFTDGWERGGRKGREGEDRGREEREGGKGESERREGGGGE